MRWMLASVLLFAAVPAVARDLQSSSPDARREMQAFGTCVANISARKATLTLNMDSRTKAYDAAIRKLAKNNEECFQPKSPMRLNRIGFQPVLLAGAMAERLMAKDPVPLNVRLVRAAAQPAPPARSIADAIALCIVRSAPDETAELFATEVASGAETQAIKSLHLAFKLCSDGRLQVNPEGLRAMLATAAFRNVHPVALAEKK